MAFIGQASRHCAAYLIPRPPFRSPVVNEASGGHQLVSETSGRKAPDKECIIETRIHRDYRLGPVHAIAILAILTGSEVACVGSSGTATANDLRSEKSADSASGIVVGPTGQSVYSNQTLQLTATVSGLSSAAVEWRIDWGGGNISSSGVLTAPAISGWATMQVSATSVSDPSVSGSVQIQQVPGASPTADQPAPVPAPLPVAATAAAASTVATAGSSTGWVPCAAQGEVCSFPPGTVNVLYGPTPDAGGHSTTKSFASVSSVLCDSATFGGNPNPTTWATNFCWYQGSTIPGQPASPLTGPAITLPLASVAFPGFATQRVQAATVAVTPGQDIGAFRDDCGFAKFDFNDPIVFPGQAEASHLHLFFGNTGVTESSTPASIQNSGSSTCGGGTLNRSAYWLPAMIDNATHLPVRPTHNNVYYKTGYNGISPAAVKAVPAGLVMITGSAKNTTRGGNPVGFACVSDSDAGTWQPNIIDCPVGYDLVMEITFPQCWDGAHLDSSDHVSHMANPVNGSCPADHPVPIPVVSYNVHYAITTPHASANYQLSSDNYDVSGGNAGYSAHADYMYGWDTATMNMFVTQCLNTSTDCHDSLLGNGQMLY
jgi:Domain of unknown function (DUF1996)